MTNKPAVTLPAPRIHVTPRYLDTDAYTIGSPAFQSSEAIQQSHYYVTYRRSLHRVNPDLYNEGDERIVFANLARILERLFYNPVTHAEIDEMKRFLATFKVTTRGLAAYDFPEALLRRVVDEFEGRPPITVLGLPEGSVVYPNEPIMQIRAAVEGFGELAAWFEAKLLKAFAVSERITQNEHFLLWLKDKIREVNPSLDDATVDFKARLMLTDMGDRAAFTDQESEDLGMAHLYTFFGTDTCSGAYQAWKNNGEKPVGNSVWALAHRNVMAFATEKECYDNMYEKGGDGEIMSMVNDAYSSRRSVYEMQIPLAKRAAEDGSGKIIVSRADSGDPTEEVLQIIGASIDAGLSEEKEHSNGSWTYPTSMHFIEADGMDFKEIKTLIEVLIQKRLVFYEWGLFGMGGGFRNGIKRDNTSAKYALCAVGSDARPVVKFSETLGKTTLPGPFKVLRSAEALENKVTIVYPDEEGVDAMVEYFNGARTEKPFGPGMDDDFLAIQNRIKEQMNSMPKSLRTDDNHGYPASRKVLDKRLELLQEYAPDKEATNY